MAQEFAIATPGTEEMTRVAIIGAGAGVTGVVQGMVVKVAPQLGALEPIFTWGTLLGIPAMGAALALFTKGMLSDAGLGIAAGGAGIIGYTLPEMLGEFGLTRRANPTGQIGPGAPIKQLMAGVMGAPQRAQQSAKVGLEF